MVATKLQIRVSRAPDRDGYTVAVWPSGKPGGAATYRVWKGDRGRWRVAAPSDIHSSPELRKLARAQYATKAEAVAAIHEFVGAED